MKAPLSILGTASQASGSPPAETFYFGLTGTDYGNTGDWFMDADLLTAASRLPGIGDDVIINNVPNFSPSLTERTYKSIEFTSFVNCSDPYAIPPFFKSPVKFITASGDITGAPVSLIANLQSAGNINFVNSVGMNTYVNKLAGNWSAVGDITLTDYYHGNEQDIIASTDASQITCQNYNLVGSLDFYVPGNESIPYSVNITQNVAGEIYPNEIHIARCTIASIIDQVSNYHNYFVAPNYGDTVGTLSIGSNGYATVNSTWIGGTLGILEVHSGILDSTYIDGTNVNLYSGSSISNLEVHNANVSFDSEGLYIAARQSGTFVHDTGLVYIAGYEHQKFTLTGGSVGDLDILVYGGSGYNLYTVGDYFSNHGSLTYSSGWDLNINGSLDGSWATGSPPLLADWSSPTSSTEPTWGTE